MAAVLQGELDRLVRSEIRSAGRPSSPGDVPHPDLMADLLQAGVPVDHHESDLYFPHDDVSVKILLAHATRCGLPGRGGYEIFLDDERKPWLCAPFHYEPFWNQQPNSAGTNGRLVADDVHSQGGSSAHPGGEEPSGHL